MAIGEVSDHLGRGWRVFTEPLVRALSAEVEHAGAVYQASFALHRYAGDVPPGEPAPRLVAVIDLPSNQSPTEVRPRRCVLAAHDLPELVTRLEEFDMMAGVTLPQEAAAAGASGHATDHAVRDDGPRGRIAVALRKGMASFVERCRKTGGA